MMPPTHSNLLHSLELLSVIGDMSTSRIWAIVLGILLAMVAITLLIASWTRWGQTKSLTKCIALAFLAHIWLLMYAYGTRFSMPGFGGGDQGGVRHDGMIPSMPILIAEQSPDELPDEDSTDSTKESDESVNDKPENGNELAAWEMPLKRAAEPELVDSIKPPELLPVPELPKPSVEPKLETTPAEPWKEPELPPLESAQQMAMLAEAQSQLAEVLPPQATAPSSLRPIERPIEIPAPSQSLPSNPVSAPRSAMSSPAAPPKRKLDSQNVPVNYQMRMSPDRGQLAILNGGDVNTEAAVERALAWLARAQSPDGSWNAAEHGAGREPSARNLPPDSEYRFNTGLKANTAMTGLALLAFLGAGHTHTDGHYQENVTRGLNYLRSQQLPSGDLSGRDQIGRDPTVRFARMYSHGMAALAVTEAYAMTGDAILLATIRPACTYTMNAMNPRTGGWRYEFPTEDPGDLSQFGWQAMLLTSAANNRSIQLPQQNRVLMQRFLDSVSTGRHGGLAVYRPRQGQMAIPEQATPAMTAEAMASRLLLGYPLSPQAAEEGQRMLLKNLPGQSDENLYYWYYGSIAMYQMRGEATTSATSGAPANTPSEQAWNQWNDALKQQLCSTQVPRGNQEGSWNPTCIWGSYGGRVYSTAVACMCLEVYYRYLPMYKAEQFANQWQPARR